jgi:predicted HAD superfamily phosphohydrolase YqeG
MLILIDLDGTLINTVHPTWKPYKDGQDNCSIEPYLDKIPVFPGAREFIASRKSKGDKIVVVSDSHFRYVNPICNMLGVDNVALADKPNSTKLYVYLDSHPNYKTELDAGNCMVIGDTKLDIELGRHIGAMTIWFLPYQISEDIKDERDGIGDEMLSKKMGPTFTAKTFAEMEIIIDSYQTHLYSIEAAFMGNASSQAVKLNNNRYADGSYACIRCLARQEQGACDKYARADKYYMMSNPTRTQEFLQTLATGISNYLNQPSLKQGWDYFTYLTDKRTTNPPNKMKDIFDLVDTSISKVKLLKWADNVQGSLREQNLYSDRQVFLQKYLSVECPSETTIDMFGQKQQSQISLKDKSIIVLDDQLTTGATAWHVIRKLKEKGVRNVLFIAMFQMILPVHNNVICPHCGKPMLIKMRRSDGHKFYSCTPPEYRGEGCGYIQDIPEQ